MELRPDETLNTCRLSIAWPAIFLEHSRALQRQIFEYRTWLYRIATSRGGTEGIREVEVVLNGGDSGMQFSYLQPVLAQLYLLSIV